MLERKLLSDQNPQMTPEITASQQQPAVRDDAARAPVKQPEHAVPAETLSSSTEVAQDDKQSSSFLGRLKDGYSAQLKGWRRKAIEITPSFIVNNSSNVLGAAHVGTEMMMFKSAMPKGTTLGNHASNPVSWTMNALKTVYTETFHAARSDNLKDLFKGNVGKNLWTRITDMEAAADRYRARPEFKGKLGNPWQFRTTGVGLVTWSLSALIPEQKESDEEIERMAIKSKTNPIGYAGERFGQALWVPEWHKHKRQMIGLGMLASGVASAIGAWRGRGDGGAFYTFNKSYLMTSLITFASGFPLMFATDEQRAYGNFGHIMLGRIPFLGFSIKDKYTRGDPGAHMYTASSVSFQVENLMQTLIGGAEKQVLPDGTVQIVDHEAIREEARKKAHLIKRGELKDRNRDGVPDTLVNGVQKAEKAMPERAHAEALQGM